MKKIGRFRPAAPVGVAGGRTAPTTGGGECRACALDREVFVVSVACENLGHKDGARRAWQSSLAWIETGVGRGTEPSDAEVSRRGALALYVTPCDNRSATAGAMALG